MFCSSCGFKLNAEARFCSSCGIAVSGNPLPAQAPTMQSSPTHKAEPRADPELREKLLASFLEFSSAQELSDWLRELDQDPSGTAEEKETRLKEQLNYPSMPPEEFLTELTSQLTFFSAKEVREGICEDLGLATDGSSDDLFRRIFREVGYREGWLPRITETTPISKAVVLPFIHWYPIVKTRKYERDYYDEFYAEMADTFGEDNVHEQIAVAHGSVLKIDFHIGHLERGVGVEFKMPANNSDTQKALGQVSQYQRRYGSELIVVLIPDLIDNATVKWFVDELQRMGVESVTKTKIPGRGGK